MVICGYSEEVFTSCFGDGRKQAIVPRRCAGKPAAFRWFWKGDRDSRTDGDFIRSPGRLDGNQESALKCFFRLREL
jgi:hypothetical protein